MPYDLVEGHSECEDGEVGLVKRETGELVACHPDKPSAVDQIAAIEASEEDKSAHSPNPQSNRTTMNEGVTDHLIGPHGGEVKDLDDKGKIGGYLVLFGGPKEHDLEKDFFTKDTDFWLDDGEGETATLWAHGTDPKIGQKRIDKDWGSVVVKDAGVWMETQLQKRNQYEEAIQKLAEKGKLGLSSGTASHLVQREKTKEGPDGVTHIKQWPIGLDGSLTPVPAEPRIKVQPLKSLSLPSIKELAMGARGAFGVQAEASNAESLEAAMKEVKAISLREKRRLIKADFRQNFGDENNMAPRVKAIYDSFLIVRGRKNDRKTLWRVSYSGNVQEGYEFADRPDWTEVVKTERFTERSVAKELENLNEFVKESIEGRNGPKSSGSSGGEDLESTLDSLVEMTS